MPDEEAQPSMDWAISPRYRNSELINGKVEPICVFEDAVKGWVFAFAHRLAQDQHGGVAVLMLAASQVEELERYRQGNNDHEEPGEFFRDGLRRIFGEAVDDAMVDEIYKNLRCGLFHEGMFRGRIVISREADLPLTRQSDGQRVIINPKLFLENVEQSFDDFVSAVRRGSQPYRDNFVSRYPPASIHNTAPSPASSPIPNVTSTSTAPPSKN